MSTVHNIVVIPERGSRVPAELFTDFELTDRKRPGVFLASFGIQAAVLALLLTITLSTAAPVLIQKHYNVIPLVAPTLSARPLARISVSPASVVSPSLDIAAPTSIPAPRASRVEVTADVPTPPVLKPVLQPSLLATVPAIPAAKPVHTGSFGDPGGVPAQLQASTASRTPALLVVGSFGTPATGDHQRGRGVATGEFSSAQSSVSGPTNKVMKSVDFTEPALATASPMAAKAARVTPVAIESKPAPVYTEEARRLRVEGDVVLEVVFAATGQIRIVGVVKGLGHGLDEAAIAATRQIRFTPARRDGQLVDYPATIHVVFALS
jgi:TonB family protein